MPMDNRTVQLDGSKLVALRRARGLSRERLAEEAKPPHRLSVATLKRAERGEAVYLETARCLSRLLQTPLDALLGTGQQVSHGPSSLSESLAVMVLPFRAVSREPESEILSYAIAEGLNQRLSTWWFPVIGHGTSVRYVDAAVPGQVADELDARYLVTGSVQRLAGEIEVRASLLNALSRQIVWSGAFRRTYSETFILQDELANAVFESIGYELLDLAAGASRTKSDSELSGWERGILGSWHFYKQGRIANAQARQYLLEAVRAEPALDWAWFLLGLTYQQEVINGWGSTQAAPLGELLELSKRYATVHPRSPRMRIIGAYASVYQGDRLGAHEQAHEARELAPNLTSAYSIIGQTLAMAGEPDTAIEQFEVALRLSPRDQDAWSIKTALALAHFVAERYEDTLAWAESAAEARPDAAFPHGTVAVASAYLGDESKAKQSLGRMLSLQPNPTRQGFATIVASTDPAIAQRYLAGLRLAGLPI